MNPLVAATMSVAEIEKWVRCLVNFGFDEFRDGNGIIEDMIAEIARYIAAIRSTSSAFWSQVNGAEAYDNNLRKKAKDDPRKYTGYTWHEDCI